MRRHSLVIVILIAAGCSHAAPLESSWLATNVRYGELTNVVTLLMTPNEPLVRTAEDQMAAHLRRHGVRATPAYAVLTKEDLADRDRATAALRSTGYDGIVVMRLVGPPTQVRIEVSAYSLNGDRLVWSALSRSSDPAELGQLVEDVTRVVSSELDQARIIPGTPAPT
jgi:hypothetical protein